MATISISTALVKEITDSLTYRVAADSTYEYYLGSTGTDYSYTTNSRAAASNTTLPFGSLFGKYSGQGQSYSGNLYLGTFLNGIVFEFKNSSNATLTAYGASEIISRVMTEDGYCVLSNFPEKIPSAAGTIDYIYISGNSGREITLSVGTTGSGADVEFVDRTLVTSQPWRLDGVIKFRIPMSFTYST